MKKKIIPDDAVDRREFGFLIPFYPNSSSKASIKMLLKDKIQRLRKIDSVHYIATCNRCPVKRG